MSQMPIRLVIAEDQALVLGALVALLSLETDFLVVGLASNGREALEQVRALQPDILVCDIEMPESSGLEVARIVAQEHPDTRVVVLTTFAKPGYYSRAVAAGVRGYLLKDCPVDELAAALRTIYRGGRVIPPDLSRVAKEAGDDPLTDRERDVLRLADEGLPNRDIAGRLELSVGTVRNYLSNAAAKLHAANRVEAGRIARSNGWL